MLIITLLWYLYSLLSIAICGNEEVPDITMVIKHLNHTHKVQYTCVAGRQVNGSAITFISPIGDNYKDIHQVSKYIHKNNEVKNKFDCDFEDESNCTNWDIGNDEIVPSGNESLQLNYVLDERWEKFQYYTKNNKYKVSENQFKITISIRFKEGSIILCNDNSTMQCYWITLNKSSENEVKYCRNVNKNKLNILDAGCTCKINTNLIPKLNEKKWTHVVISKKSAESNITFENEKNMMLSFPDSESVGIKNIIVQVNSKGYYKIHKYNYLSLKMSNNSWRKIGPELQPQNDSLCITLYAAACYGCTLSFKIEEENEIVQGNNQWTFVRIILQNATKASYNLQIKQELANETSGFWYIDEIRQCYLNEQRIISMTAAVNSKDKVSCIALKYPAWGSSNIGAEVGVRTLNDNKCDDAKYIGQNCTIPCSSIFGEDDNNKFCNSRIICKPSVKSNSYCYCAAGYRGYGCNETCPGGYYGYNCHKVCEPCYNFCLQSSGICPITNNCMTHNSTSMGCTIPYLYKMLSAPQITKSTLKSITVKPVINNGTENVVYQVQYKKKSARGWENVGSNCSVSQIVETTIPNLTPLSTYEVRLVLYSENQNTTVVDHIYSSVETKCEEITNMQYYDNLTLTENKNNLEIYWRAICEANISFVLEPDKNMYDCKVSHRSEQILVKYQNYTIPDLYPDVNYNLQINVILENNTIHSENKIFKISKNEYPVLKQGPLLINPTLHNITVQFSRKDIENSKLTKFYKIQYKSENEDWKVTENKTILKTNSYTLYELNMNTLYYVRVVFYNEMNKYDKCIHTSNIITNCKDPSSHKLIKDFNVTCKENEIVVNWQAVCNNSFQISALCTNSWCDESNNKKDDVNSVKEKYIIENLIPFTNYTITFLVHDAKNNDSELKNIRTLSAAPPAVRNFHVYSFNEKDVSVRFQEPYPPYGTLSNYTVYINCTQQNYTRNSENCEIWKDYKCITISLNTSCANINITIAAKNEEVDTKGTSRELIISLRNTENPVNITSNKKLYNVLEFSWFHPEFMEGNLIGFVINVTQLDTSLMDSNFDAFYEICNNTLSYTYNYELKHTLPPSSTYEIIIQGKNEAGKLGDANKTIIYTSPPQPTLNGNLSVYEWTNYTQKINIPSLNQDTLTKTSSIYLVICDPISHHGLVEKDYNVSIKDKLIDWTNCTGIFWVASMWNVSSKENKLKNIFHFDENTEKLKLDINYTVSVLVINEYNNEYNYSKYSFITPAPKYTTFNPAFYALFLLLLIIPVIGYFIYRQRKLNIAESDTAFEEIPAQTNNFAMNSMFNSISKNKSNWKNEHLSTSELEQPLINQNENSIYTKTIKVCDLSQYIKESLENGELKNQHALFPKGGIKPWDYGMNRENKFKNRYNNLTAYDHSRVVLKKIQGDNFSDFINANYIDGYKTPQAYIATQGPKPSTVHDFWRMIWQENVKYIVMLANLVESNKQKCHQYWPSEIGTTNEYINVLVTFLHSDIYADFEYRTFEVISNGQSRKIQQLHFTSWPDHGIPQYPQSLVPFVRKILAASLASPIVVHCSAGVGRTGTIILCDICLRMAAAEQQVDVLKYMHSIREQRANLVDNFDQYKLVHMILLECLLAPETSLTCNNLEENVNNMIKQGGLQKQIEYLKNTAWHDQVMSIPIKLNDNYASKNRFSDIIPDVRRIYISRYPFDDEYSDYINAVPVDGFRSKDQFIVTQTPLPHTVKDFWRMIFENNVKIIVSLNEINIKDNTCCIFWPLENEKLTPVSYITLHCQSVREGMHFDNYNIQIINTSQECETMVKIIQLKNWKREQIIPDDIHVFINIIEEAQSFSRQGNPVAVTCYDGATASGLYVALYFLIEKIKLEQMCDVCQAVRAIRINRPQFISNRKQFEFLYNAAVQYVASFEGYSNFETFRKN